MDRVQNVRYLSLDDAAAALGVVNDQTVASAGCRFHSPERRDCSCSPTQLNCPAFCRVRRARRVQRVMCVGNEG